ncbi:Synaptotagmin-9 [Armadillidium vulgare]|nr:Synaptotagmin-9 [Armadillidium vulgare]
MKMHNENGSGDLILVSLLCQGKRIKKKKTSVKRATLNPVYNESLVFDVPNENIQDTTLLVKVLDYDRVGSNELMGVVVIGNQAMGQGRDHWIEMLESSRYPIAQWYTLMDSVPNTIPVTPINVSAPLSCLSST